MKQSVLSWLPGETLFSYVSRFHRIGGSPSERVTIEHLFGAGARIYHDFPSHLAHFCTLQGDFLVTPPEIVFRCTPLSLYLRFQDSQRAREVLDETLGAPRSTTKFRLGLVGSRFGASHPLKACEQCMSEDASNYGLAYWHMVHQCPGVFVCPYHERTLLIAETTSQRQSLVLPFQAKFGRGSSLNPGETSSSAAASLAGLIREAIALPVEFRFDPRLLSSVLIKGCRDNSLMRSESGRLNVGALAREYLVVTQGLRAYSGMAVLPASAPEAGAQVRRVLSSVGFRSHPLRYLLLIQTLFGSWTKFFSEYSRHTAMSASVMPSMKELGVQFSSVSPSAFVSYEATASAKPRTARGARGGPSAVRKGR